MMYRNIFSLEGLMYFGIITLATLANILAFAVRAVFVFLSLPPID